MSQHADITKWAAAKAIQNNWGIDDTCEHYAGVLGMSEYDIEWANPRYIIETAEMMLKQTDGLYGPSHAQIVEWLQKNIGGLIVEQVLFEEKHKKS